MRLSVIIPTLNGAEMLPACVAALGPVAELIVSDGGSSDDTVQIAKDLGAQVISGPASRGGQLRRGCAMASQDWLLICHADTLLAPGWQAAALAHMETRQAGWFRLRFDEGGRAVAAWANLRSRIFGLPFGDQGLLLPKALYDRVGGYPDQPLMEDIAIARALRGHLCAIDADAVTSAAKYKGRWIRRGARNLWTQARYFAGVAPEHLARAYRK